MLDVFYVLIKVFKLYIFLYDLLKYIYTSLHSVLLYFNLKQKRRHVIHGCIK